MKLLLLTVAVILSMTAITANAQLSKNNPDDICKSAKNVQNTTQTITYCVDEKTKEKYIPKVEPKISTDGIFMGSAGMNTSDFVFLETPPDSNVSISQLFTAKTPTHLILLDAKQICLITGDVKCQKEQSEYVTHNLTTTVDSSGNWHIKGFGQYIGPATSANTTVHVLFYDEKGVSIGGFVSQKLVPPNLIVGSSGSFKIDTVKSSAKIMPFYIVLTYSKS